MISTASADLGRFSDITVLVPKAIGVALLSSVVVRALKKRAPDRNIRCVARHGVFFHGCPYVEEVIDPNTPYLFRDAIQDKHVIDLSRYLDYQPNRREVPVHLLDLLCNQAGVQNDGGGPECFLQPEEEAWAKAEIARHQKPGASATILITTRTSTVNKEWRQRRWIELVRHFGSNVLWLHVGDPRGQVLEGVVYLSTSPRQTIALAGAVTGVVTLDTFLLHAAACARNRTGGVVTILGSSRPECVSYAAFRNLYVKEYDCQPCGRPYGSHDFNILPNGEVMRWPNGKAMKWVCEHVSCMDLVSVASVIESIDECILQVKPWSGYARG